MRYTEFKTILKEESSSDYTVVAGDNLTKIAKMHSVKLADLIAANKQIKNPDRIYPGDVITIPGAGKPIPKIKKEKPPVKKQPSGKHEIRNVAAANEAFDFFKGKFNYSKFLHLFFN
jgi:LysM repeat protein